MRSRHFIELLKRTTFTTMLLGVSCGAPLKKADDVSSIFSNTESLGMKVANLCNLLTGSQQAPNLTGVDLGLEACSRAGLQAQNLSLNTPLEFTSTRADGQKFATDSTGVANKTDSLLRFQTRVEIWLGKSLLGLITEILPSLSDKSKSLFSQSGGVASNTGVQNDMQIKLLSEPQFDSKNLRLGLDIYLESLRAQNGAADIRNKFRIDGALFDKKYIAATVVTSENVDDVKTSLIHKGKILIFVVPHAQDIYVDVTFDFTFHSFGVDEAMKQQVQGILGDAIKSMIQQMQSGASTGLAPGLTSGGKAP